MKVTHWFDYETKPFHIGVYEVRALFSNLKFKAYWDGTQWCSKFENHRRLNFQNRAWRGLLEKSC